MILLAPPPVLYRPALGAEATYVLKGTFEGEGDPFAIDATVRERVALIAPDGTITVETTPILTKINLRGELREVKGGPVTRRTYGPGGELSNFVIAPGSKAAHRAALLQLVPNSPATLLPEDAWKLERPADAVAGLPSISRIVHHLGREKVGTRELDKLKLDARETSGLLPASLEATVWLDPADGRPWRWDGRWKNVPIDEAGGTVTGSFTLERQEASG